MIIKHRYVETRTLSASSSTATQFLSCNGMRDPNVSGTGHQPLYFDQQTALYGYYVVTSSKCKWTIAPASASLEETMLVSVQINDDLTSTAITGTREQNSSQNRVLGGTNSPYVVINQYWDAKSRFGKNPTEQADLKGTSTTDPTNLDYFMLFMRPFDNASSVSCDVLFELEYTAHWFDHKDVENS